MRKLEMKTICHFGMMVKCYDEQHQTRRGEVRVMDMDKLIQPSKGLVTIWILYHFALMTLIIFAIYYTKSLWALLGLLFTKGLRAPNIIEIKKDNETITIACGDDELTATVSRVMSKSLVKQEP